MTTDIEQKNYYKQIVKSALKTSDANKAIEKLFDKRHDDWKGKLDLLQTEFGIIVGSACPASSQSEQEILRDSYYAALDTLIFN